MDDNASVENPSIEQVAMVLTFHPARFEFDMKDATRKLRFQLDTPRQQDIDVLSLGNYATEFKARSFRSGFRPFNIANRVSSVIRMDTESPRREAEDPHRCSLTVQPAPREIE